MRPAHALQHALTLAWRSMVKLTHSPTHVLDLVLQPILFVVLFVFLFGGAIASDWREYLQYVLPGIMVQAVVLATTATGAGLNIDIHRGIIDRFRSLPIARSAPLVGMVVGDMVRYAVSGAVVMLFGIALGFEVKTGVLPALGAYGLIMVFAVAMCWVSALIGVVAGTGQQMHALSAMLMFPLTFGSNIFVPTDTLPGWLRAWADINPVSTLVEAVRGLLLGGPLLGPVTQTLVAAAVMVLVFGPLATWAYLRRV